MKKKKQNHCKSDTSNTCKLNSKAQFALAFLRKATDKPRPIPQNKAAEAMIMDTIHPRIPKNPSYRGLAIVPRNR